MMTTPIRIQRKRSKGWRKPENTVYVGRAGKANSKWGNPYKIGARYNAPWCTPQAGIVSDAACAKELYRQYITYFIEQDVPGAKQVRMALQELRGKDLVCWCPLDQPCHADVLLELANR